MKKRLWVLTLVILLTACGGEGAESGRLDDLVPLFQQELHFLQQGFRQHGIEGAYTVYFAPPEEGSQTLLVEGDKGCWEERFSLSLDGERNWYAFTGVYEPVLTGAEPDMGKEEAEAFKAAAVYRAALSADTDLEGPIRFDIPPGPVTNDSRRETGDLGRLETWLYLYQDQRLGFTAQIEYPRYSLYISGLSDPERVNRILREAFFYGYGGEPFQPERERYGQIQRTYEVTRRDEGLFSARIYESNAFRGAAHPNDWYSGVTVDLETGSVLTLRDILGPEGSADVLLDSGAFRCLQLWGEPAENREETDRMQIEEARGSFDLDSAGNFYLGKDALGLIAYSGRYCFCMEAPLADLGLEDWVRD